jgi:hypothetical protein
VLQLADMVRCRGFCSTSINNDAQAGTLHVFKGGAYIGLDYSKLQPTDGAQLQRLIDQAQTVLKQSGNTYSKKLTQIADDLWRTVV